MLKRLWRIALLRTVYHSVRHRSWVIVSRGTRLDIARDARIEVEPGGRLVLGLGRIGGTPCGLSLRPGARLSVGGTVEVFRGARITVDEGAHLTIGDQTYLNHDSVVTCWTRMAIGSRCAISWNVSLLDGNGHELLVGGDPRPVTATVDIGDHVWIGVGATVIGAAVGPDSVVAAGSVVVSDVPAGMLVAGNPARVVHEQVSWQL